ncbi:MAG: tyrosine--tRNA ligase 2 [Acidimicrobiales bacterium]|nr:MAG: tyrosine--tRNA ligase 2 [Acidimicrobiales bacterium]
MDESAVMDGSAQAREGSHAAVEPRREPSGSLVGEPLCDDLLARGLVHDVTDVRALADRLRQGRVVLYCGFDPTAPSLHLGHLVPLLVLRRFARHGHGVLVVAGGATGMIGDPSGRSSERRLLSEEELERNLAAVERQLARLVGESAEVLDNRTWLAGMGVLEFLREVGKHVTVNVMLAKESVRARVAGSEGISYTEFSYMLLQAYDFLWLYRHRGCELQIGGSDQWGNITLGLDLIRRCEGAVAHGLTVPLVTRSDGQKFGKSEGENIWLDPALTSPYRLWQYFVNTDDRDVARFLMQLTLLEVDEVRAVVAEHSEAPERRRAQRLLANEVTTLVHGRDAAERAEKASEILFGSGAVLTPDVLEMLADEIPTTRVAPDRLPVGLVTLLAETDLAKSKSDARRALEEGSLWLNGRRLSVEDEAKQITPSDLVGGRFALARRGRRRWALVDFSR